MQQGEPESTTPCSVGTFDYDMASGILSWSDQLYRIYGYAVGSVTPTTELLIDACHPDDRAQAERILSTALESGTGCVHAHRIVTPSGTTKHIVIVGAGTRDDAGVTSVMSGYAVDVTAATNSVVAESVKDAVSSVVASRAVIEQAKGALMLAFGVDADTAFGVLSWQSQTHNLKLRALAEQVMTDVRNNGSVVDDMRSGVSHLILTAHERVSRA